MNWLQIPSWNILHDRIGEVKWNSNFRVSIYKYKQQSRYRLWFYPLWENQWKYEINDISFLWFRIENGKLVFSWLYVPTERRLNWMWKLMFEVFTRIQDLLNVHSYETVKIHKPNISIFLNKLWFNWNGKWVEVLVIWKTDDWTPIIKQSDWLTICKWKKWHKFLVIDESSNEEDWIIATVWTKFRLDDYNLFSQFRDDVSVSYKIQIYKWRIKKILL